MAQTTGLDDYLWDLSNKQGYYKADLAEWNHAWQQIEDSARIQLKTIPPNLCDAGLVRHNEEIILMVSAMNFRTDSNYIYDIEKSEEALLLLMGETVIVCDSAVINKLSEQYSITKVERSLPEEVSKRNLSEVSYGLFYRIRIDGQRPELIQFVPLSSYRR